MAHVVASGAGMALMERRDDPTHDYVLALTGVERPRVLFVGTAAGDDPAYALAFYSTYHADRCVPRHLPLFARDVDDLAAFVRGFDVIHVGGGSTANLLDVWRRHGLDDILAETWSDPGSNVVLTGGSAGAICWFEGGVTDSYGPTLRALPEGLGFVPGSFCAHADVDPRRRPVFERAIRSGELPAGYAVGEFQSLHFTGTGGHVEFVTALGGDADGLALRVEADGDRVTETPLPMRVLATSAPPDASPAAGTAR